MSKTIKTISLNGDLLSYYYTSRNLVLQYHNSRYSYYLPPSWYIEPTPDYTSPYRLTSSKISKDGITVATSMYGCETNLIKFIIGLVREHNDPTLTELRVLHGSEEYLLDLTCTKDIVLPLAIATEARTKLIHTEYQSISTIIKTLNKETT